MYKRFGAYSLKEGTDEEAFWKYHTQEHAAHCVEVTGHLRKKYILNRVIKTAYGERPFFVILEEVFDSEEAANENTEILKATKLPSGKTVYDDFSSQEALLSGPGFVAEEFIVKDPGTKIYATTDSKVVKRVFTTSLREGVDEGAFWEYWTEKYVPDIVRAAGSGLLKCVLNRVAKMRKEGKKPFFALLEDWFDSEAAMDAGLKNVETWKTLKPPSGQSRVVDSWAGIVEEFVANDIMP